MEVNHGCFQGSVGAFDALRLVWSDMAGYGVVDHRDEGGPIMPRLDFDWVTESDTLGEWPDGAPDDPLLILLVHQEQAGRIKVTHCSYLADRLEMLESVMIKIPNMTKWLLLTQQFIRGLRTAVSYNQDVVFS